MKKRYLYGIDPGLVNVGIVILPVEGKAFNFSLALQKGKVLFKYFGTEAKLDIGTRGREIRLFFDNLFSEYPPHIVFLEDVDFRPFISRKSQAYLFGALMVVLSSLPSEAGYRLIDKVKLKNLLGLKTKKGKALSKEKTHEVLIERFPKLKEIKEQFKTYKRYEHIFDATVVLLAGIELLKRREPYD